MYTSSFAAIWVSEFVCSTTCPKTLPNRLITTRFADLSRNLSCQGENAQRRPPLIFYFLQKLNNVSKLYLDSFYYMRVYLDFRKNRIPDPEFFGLKPSRDQDGANKKKFSLSVRPFRRRQAASIQTSCCYIRYIYVYIYIYRDRICVYKRERVSRLYEVQN